MTNMSDLKLLSERKTTCRPTKGQTPCTQFNRAVSKYSRPTSTPWGPSLGSCRCSCQ